MENIRYGRPDASDREVVEAAVRARIHDDIMQMPDGYDTFVGERGVVLSGGQKQRVSIARVFLKNPPILILDEATSALDSVTERQIQDSLDALSQGKTCIVIAHRLSTVRGADRIAVVDGMHITEQGSRDELMALNGAYARLERAQELQTTPEVDYTSKEPTMANIYTDPVKIIELKESVLEDNNKDAQDLRSELKAQKTCLLNLMSGPGSGKTTTLLALDKYLRGRLNWGVMEADIDSDVDARTILAAGIPAVQLHTGGMCHLDADMTRQGLKALFESTGEHLDLVVLENIGNLVCPAEFDTGAAIKMTILSVPEGDDKPAKYPLMYEECDIMVVNKIDALPVFDFDKEKAERFAKYRNPDIKIFYISARTGEGVEALADEIIGRVAAWNA